MTEPTRRPGESAQPSADATTAEPVRLGRDDPAPGDQPGTDAPSNPPPRRDNPGEAITGGPIV